MAILAQLLDDVVVHKFDLVKSEMTLGRKAQSDIVIDDSAISSQHARVLKKSNEFFPQYQELYVEDLGSTNGTFLNEQPVVGRQRLRNGDTLRLAWNHFKFIDEQEAEMEKTVQMLRTSSE